eukprot:9209386-Alexandrium_andersonii.AAC.1
MLIGAATVVEAAYDAAALFPENPQVKSTMAAGITAISSAGLTQFHQRTPPALLHWRDGSSVDADACVFADGG